MKTILLTLVLLLLIPFSGFSQSTFDLDASQSMCISGKGPGQDGAINPFLDGDSMAIIENLGESSFSVRIQKAGEITQTITVASKQIREVKLPKNHVLYLDTESKAKAKVSFKDINE